MIVRKADIVRKYVEAILGEPVDGETHELIVRNAGGRASFSTGKQVIGVYQTIDGPEGPAFESEVLEGSHNEVVAAINMRAGTTLSRELLAEKYGNEYQSFNIDAWAFARGAEAISSNEEEVRQKVAAMTYYNVATALVLCGPDMRVVIVN